MNNRRHVNIPIFIPHLGCPNCCVFCNQRSISGVSEFDINTVSQNIEEALSTTSVEDEVEIAFFGGSFTGIDRKLMIDLLNIAESYVRLGKVHSIRCSTRPDYINDEVLDILMDYSVKTIELGLQSFSDRVLLNSKRGHTSYDAERACKLVIEKGFNLVGQMMVGLPGSTVEDELYTARKIVSLGASSARIYPTLVFYDTELSAMVCRGDYAPITLDEAVSRSAEVFEIFYNSNVEVIRIGLCSSDGLSDETKFHCGPNHPAIGEMILGEFMYKRIRSALLSSVRKNKRPIVKVGIGRLSIAIGQKKINKNRLINELDLDDLRFLECDEISGLEFTID